MQNMNSRFTGIIFDMDGTITRPVLNFALIRAELDMPEGDLLEEINSLPEPERQKAWSIVERHEERALEEVKLQDGAAALLGRCRTSRIKLGLLTRNLQRSVDHICDRFEISFDTVITREFLPSKPHPGPVLHILETWQVPSSEVLVVGDYIHDIECGRAAGCSTCFFQNDGKPSFGEDAEYTVTSMNELEAIIFPA